MPKWAARLIEVFVISEEEARRQILETVHLCPQEKVRIADADGRFVAGEIRAAVAIPSFDNSAMDGYAVVAETSNKGARLRLVGEQPAGRSLALSMRAGEAVRIFTGAPLPAGADAVVMQEETTREGSEVVINAENVSPGEFVRRIGGDLTIGQLIAKAGEMVTPALIGLLAAQGVSEINVGKRARVAVISTGDELVPAGTTLRPGEIYDSNATMLAAMVVRTGAEVAGQEHCGDDANALRETVTRALENDAVIISGGVSVGERDFVRAVLKELGVEIDLWRVAMKPGKPFLFARRGDCCIFGLPGNPVSSFVTFQVLVRPALRRMMGATRDEDRGALVRVEEAVVNDGERAHYLRGEVRGGVFRLVGGQESHALFGLARAHVLLRLGPGEKVTAGDIREVLPLQ